MSAAPDETATMLALTLARERGLLPAADRAWAAEVLARRQASGWMEPATLAAAASLLARHRPVLVEHGIACPELPQPLVERVEPAAARAASGPRVELTVAATGELKIAGAPFAMREAFKALPGHRWDRKASAWFATAAPAVAAAAAQAVRAHGGTLAMGARAKALAVEASRRRDVADVLDPSSPLPDIDWSPHVLRQPWAHQLRGAEFIVASSAVCIGAPPGPMLETMPILTPSGWRKFGELVAGDEVYGADGAPVRVRAVRHYGLHPVFRVTLSDGTSTVTSGGHRWRVRTRDDLAAGNDGRVMTTEQMVVRGLHAVSGSVRNRRFTLPDQPVLQFPDAVLPIPPYSLGALIGDGSLGTGHAAISLCCPDDDIMVRVRDELSGPFGLTPRWIPTGDRCQYLRFSGSHGGRSNPLIKAIKALNLRVTSHHKHIPPQYLTASTAQRTELLRGLFDTDGSPSKAQSVEYSTVSSRLAEDVAFLARSLGCRVRVVSRSTSCQTGTFPSYRVSIKLAAGLDAFYCERKRARSAVSVAPVRRAVESIEPEGHDNVCCIELDVSDPDRAVFLGDSTLIPSLNSGKTAMSFLALNLLDARRVLVVCPNTVRGTWVREADRHSVRPWHVVDGRRPSKRARSGFVDLGIGDRMRQAEHALFDCGCGRPHLVAVNYEVLTHEVFDGWVPRERLDAVIYDECHRLGAHGVRTRSGGRSVSGRAADWVSLSDRRFGLSGTPFGGDPAEGLFSTYRALDPGIFGTVWTYHDARYRIKNPKNANHVIGFQNLAELARKAAPILFRPTVDLDLPEATTQTVEVELDAATMRAYRQMETEMVAELAAFVDPGSASAVKAARDAYEGRLVAAEQSAARGERVSPVGARLRFEAARTDDGEPDTQLTAANPMVRLLRLQQLTGGVLATDDGVEARVWDTGPGGDRPSAKGEALGGVLDQVGCVRGRVVFDAASGVHVAAEPEPVVVFGRFSSDLAQVREVAQARGLRYGEISGPRKDGLTRTSTMSPDVDVVGVQIQAGGTGIELVRARVVVWWSVGYSLVNFDQAMKRVHRPGQLRPVLNVFLVAAATKDVAVYDALDGRRSTVAEVFRLAGYADEEVEALVAATSALDGTVDGTDAAVPDRPRLRSDAASSAVAADLGFLDGAGDRGDEPVYKPRVSRVLDHGPTGAPGRSGSGRSGVGPGGAGSGGGVDPASRLSDWDRLDAVEAAQQQALWGS